MAKRYSYRDMGNSDFWTQFWQHYELFELTAVHTVLRLLIRPGLVAREYVLGARERYVHPVSLLLLGVGFLVFILGRTDYLTAGQPNLTPVMEQVGNWSQWSFSLGLFAIWISAGIIFWGRLGYNALEKAVLSAYTQVAIIVVNLINLLPLLVLNSPEAILSHRHTSNLYMTWIELAIVGLAFYQYFRIKPGRDLIRLGLAVAAYYFVKKGLLLAYARFIVFIVLGQ